MPDASTNPTPDAKFVSVPIEEWTASLSARLATDPSVSGAIHEEMFQVFRQWMDDAAAEKSAGVLFYAVFDASLGLAGMARMGGVSVAQIAHELRTQRETSWGSQPDASTDDREL